MYIKIDTEPPQVGPAEECKASGQGLAREAAVGHVSQQAARPQAGEVKRGPVEALVQTPCYWGLVAL